MFHSIWDVAMSEEGKTVIAFAETNEITVITCEKFDCKNHNTATILAPGSVTNIKLNYIKYPSIIFSIENGASAIANCIDAICSSVSLIRVSDYVSSSNFAVISSTTDFTLYANDKIQSYNNPLASPHEEHCRSTITGNHAIENGEVYICNSLQSPEFYSQVFFWTPVVTSVFAQNL